MSTSQKKYDIWLNALNLLYGPSRVRRILATAKGDPKKAWSLSTSSLKMLGLKEENIGEIALRREKIDPTYEWERLDSLGIKTLALDSKHYSALLKETSSPPLLLYTKGDTSLLGRPSLAVVGTRAPSSYGKECVGFIVSGVARAGIVVVSGLAQGIDALAHEETLEAKGRTIAVLGNGLDDIFPSLNRSLGERILNEGGLIISEYAAGMPPLKQNFPARNRLIAGISLGTLVIESRDPGGSLITASFALEEGRDVFAVPGPITSPASEGTNRLLKEGATAVTSTKDILEALRLPMETRNIVAEIQTLSVEEQKILDALSMEALHIDSIIKQTTLSSSKVAVLLTSLELKGVIKNIGGNIFKKNT